MIESEMVRKPEIITPESLLADNQSALALGLRREFIEAKKADQLLLASSCGDSRVFLTGVLGTNAIARFRSIAGVISPEVIKGLAKEKGINGLLVVTHWDGLADFENGKPAGCGGLSAKEHIDELNVSGDFEKYIRGIQSSDPAIQAFNSALLAARFTDKPVIPAVYNHRTGQIDPLGIITDRGLTKEFFPHLDQLRNGDLSEFYKENGNVMPGMQFEDIPEEFREYFAANRRFVEEVGSTPDFRESQRVQNPDAVAITMGRRPYSIKYPGHFGKPNKIFTLMLAKEYSEEELKNVTAELWYPISHATTAEPGGSFSNTKTLLIETPDIVESKRIAHEVSQQEWMREWRNAGGRIIVNEMHNGELQKSEFYEEVISRK